MGREMLRGVYPEPFASLRVKLREGLSMTRPVLVVKIHHRRPTMIQLHKPTHSYHSTDTPCGHQIGINLSQGERQEAW